MKLKWGAVLTALFLVSLISHQTTLLANGNQVETVLYLSKGNDQPLVVGLGGSEGGNAWTSDRWKATRDKFLAQGYAFLAVGYFGAKETPKQLDRIDIGNIYNAIQETLKHPLVRDRGVAMIGGSKGAELALLMASYYPSITCVVSIVGSHATFPALTLTASTSSWTFKGKEVPYVPMPWSAVPAAIKGDLRRAFEIMLEDEEAVQKAIIKVENIKGPILLVSAKKDEMWPSTEMSEQVMQRLKKNNFPFTSKHLAIEGGHLQPLKHFDEIVDFLTKEYPVK